MMKSTNSLFKKMKKIKKKLKEIQTRPDDDDNFAELLFNQIAPSVAIVRVTKSPPYCTAEELEDEPDGPEQTVSGFVVYSKQRDNLVLTLVVSVASVFKTIVNFSNSEEHNLFDDRSIIKLSFFKDNYSYKGRVIVFAPDIDMVLYSTHCKVVPALDSFYEMLKIPRGLPVYCIGHDTASGESYCFTTGNISHECNEYKGDGDGDDALICNLIMHHTPAEFGTSGAPVFTKKGKVIGMQSHCLMETTTSFFVSYTDIKIELASVFPVWDLVKRTLPEILHQLEQMGEFEKLFSLPEEISTSTGEGTSTGEATSTGEGTM